MAEPILRIQGLPDFNIADTPYLIDDVEGWWDTPAVRANLIPNGGGIGSVAVGTWTHAEKYTTLTGTVLLPAAEQDPVIRALKVAFRPGVDVAVRYLGGEWEPDKIVTVRGYDKIAVRREYNHFTFAVPLVQPDPHKYSAVRAGANMGIYIDATHYQQYENIGGGWVMQYEQPGQNLRYQVVQTNDGRPVYGRLVSNGDVASRQLTITLYGPIPLGWYIANDATGQRIYSRVAIPETAPLVLDMANRSATLGDNDVTYKTFGDWLTYEPGVNQYRLVSAARTGGWAEVIGRAAYL